MKRKIAIPVENGIMTGHFGHAPFFALIEMDGQNIVKEELLVPPPHEPGVLPAWLNSLGATDIIAGGMGQRAIQLFQSNNINVFVGAAQKTATELALELVNNSLTKGSNYCDH
ncbi:MAG TPA: ATPase [Bacteroidales bacterium]|nr:ATPase [Bacteroidales bacterium]